jgi:hypothetical protein
LAGFLAAVSRGILLSIHADDKEWKNKGRDILKRTGADDIGDKGESKADYDVSDRPYPKRTDTSLQTDYGDALKPRTVDSV